MTYYLGVDLGTTYTAASVWREGNVRVVDLGTRSPVIPSVVFLRDDEAVLTGEAADRRGTTEPGRVAREFKRRIGDPTPIIVGGTPYSADSLMGKLLRWVVDKVSEVEGGVPAGIAVSHPANWGNYKKDLLRQAIAIADLDDVAVISEPEAAAIHYASQARVDVGATIAVYDLGGGTFDAAVLRKIDDGFEVLGDPQGIERLGGVDFDEAVFQHVVVSIGDGFEQLDFENESHIAAVTRLRAECAAAKEALSSDTDVSIPVLLPTVQTEVRLTRGEFEAMIRPSLADSMTAVRRALRSADVEVDDISAVLLVGGSSRIPLVAQLVGAEFGRPVAVDAHPKHGIALGAGIYAAQHGEPKAAHVADATVVPSAPEAPVAPAAAMTIDPDATVQDAPAPAPAPAADAAPAAPPPPAPAPPPAADEPTVADMPAAAAPMAAGGPARPDVAPPAAAAATPPPASPPPAAAPPPAASGGDGGGRSKTPIFVGAGVLVAIVIGIVVALSGGGDDSPTATGDTTTTEADASTSTAADDSTTTTEATTTTTAATTTTVFDPGKPFVRLTGVTVEGDSYRAEWETFEFTPVIGPGELHIHVFLNTTEPANAGSNGNPPGDWELTDQPSDLLTKYGPGNRGAATQLCTVVADENHAIPDPNSGNCVDLPDA